MRHWINLSIRSKLFGGTLALVVFFVFVSWLLNTRYLSTYYMSEKKKDLITAGAIIDESYKGDPSGIYPQLENLQRTNGLDIAIFDQQFELKYDSGMVTTVSVVPGGAQVTNTIPGISSASGIQSGRNLAGAQGGMKIGVGSDGLSAKFAIDDPQMAMRKNNLSTLVQGQNLFAITPDPSLRENVLNMYMLLKNGDYLMMNIPLATLQDSADIANRFFLYTGLATIAIGSVGAFLFARRFTRPILALNDIAQRMEKLDFTAKYPASGKDEIGQLGRSINLLSDQLDESISQLQRSNQQLLEDIERERKLDEMRKEFVSSVSHELKTPISLIQGYAEGLLVNVVQDQDKRNHYCSVIIDEAGRMDKLVKDLLNLSQLESGYIHLEKYVFDISALVDRVLSKFQPIFSAKFIEVDVDKDDNTFVNGDPSRIQQVLVNYLNNAINHLDERKLLRVSIHSVADRVRVSVFNSGDNIPEEVANDIWRSFYKVDKARLRSHGGSGLGLSIVRAIQELHGNAYGMDNLEDGVSFWFELDRANQVDEDF